MKTKFRIVRTEKMDKVSYSVQKKSWLGFWYSIYIHNGCVKEEFDNIEDAKKSLNRLQYKTIKTVVYQIKRRMIK